jgi:putative transposase
MLTWAHTRGVALRLIQPGKPTQNAFVESFNGRFRDAHNREPWSCPAYSAHVCPRFRAMAGQQST